MFHFGDFPGARAVEDLRLHRRVYVVGALLAPLAEGVLNHRIGGFFVALADDHIDRRLAADELGEGRNHYRIAQLGAHLGDLVEHLGDFSSSLSSTDDAG
jgi:hypothetical protein